MPVDTFINKERQQVHQSRKFLWGRFYWVITIPKNELHLNSLHKDALHEETAGVTCNPHRHHASCQHQTHQTQHKHPRLHNHSSWDRIPQILNSFHRFVSSQTSIQPAPCDVNNLTHKLPLGLCAMSTTRPTSQEANVVTMSQSSDHGGWPSGTVTRPLGK